MTEAGLFEIIESVLKEREGQGAYTTRQKVYDVMSAVDKHRPGTSMSNGEIAKILGRVKAYMPRHGITRCLIELQDLGKIEFAGREVRKGKSKDQRVPVYRVTHDA